MTRCIVGVLGLTWLLLPALAWSVSAYEGGARASL